MAVLWDRVIILISRFRRKSLKRYLFHLITVTEKKSDDENEDNDDVNEVETFATETEKQTEEITSDYLDVTIELYMCQE